MGIAGLNTRLSPLVEVCLVMEEVSLDDWRIFKSGCGCVVEKIFSGENYRFKYPPKPTLGAFILEGQLHWDLREGLR